ncbi:hypothetical protein GDO86_018328, partial [Hymenochirus boettgeri]
DCFHSKAEVTVKIEPEEQQEMWHPERNLELEISPRAHAALPITSRHPGHTRERGELRPIRGERGPVPERERQRSFKFTEEENDILIRKILENYDKILGKLATRTSTTEKAAIWRNIAAAVNGVSAYTRTTMQCKKRYADIKKKVKEKMAKQRRHQSRAASRHWVAVSFWPYEKYLMRLISCENELIAPDTNQGTLMIQEQIMSV